MSGQGNYWDLRLIGGWQLRRGERQPRVAARQQRLIAALALHGGQPFSSLADLLWPGVPGDQWRRSLRACLSLVTAELPGLVFVGLGRAGLAEGVQVDVHEVRRQVARSIGRGELLMENGSLETLRHGELLPGWEDGWVAAERQQWRCLRITVFERLARQLLAQGDTYGAVDAACAAVAIEAPRETAQQLVLRIQLAEGNQAEALESLRAFTAPLLAEFGASAPTLFSAARAEPFARLAEPAAALAEPAANSVEPAALLPQPALGLAEPAAGQPEQTG
ncbi:DNA-binding transcriptional activator [Arthrobacter crystallopoietes BAB-32]|uniref:DNA-binding transcriptional activator n=1 Tax=Arthrobacter crystallopoietes BAB-32 TaxID=1246476 RepID=N1UYE6_9MICC|nr:bacterial transcriptional activator domain-containing protein [Arthrobacter crystallopoietes]EMY32784.1 DNA-binding transcriptional activator [Arthrobacter crystallopoietes BAB-32]